MLRFRHNRSSTIRAFPKFGPRIPEHVDHENAKTREAHEARSMRNEAPVSAAAGFVLSRFAAFVAFYAFVLQSLREFVVQTDNYVQQITRAGSADRLLCTGIAEREG